MTGNVKVFWVYLITGLIYPCLKIAIYICVGLEEANCYWGFLRMMHYELHYNPQYLLAMLAILLSGFALIRGLQKIVFYAGIVLLNLFAYVVSIPFPW